MPAGWPNNWRSAPAARRNQASSSSGENRSSSEYMRAPWVTGANASEASPPTSWVGESFDTSSGCSDSMSSSSR